MRILPVIGGTVSQIRAFWVTIPFDLDPESVEQGTPTQTARLPERRTTAILPARTTTAILPARTTTATIQARQ